MSHVPEPELATDLVEYFVAVLPDRASLGRVGPALGAGTCGREQAGELAVPVIVVHDDQRAARPQDPEYLRESGIAAGRPEIGKPGMHDVGAGVGQRNVLRRAVQHHGPRVALGR